MPSRSRFLTQDTLWCLVSSDGKTAALSGAGVTLSSSIEKVSKIPSPVLIIHGTEDEVIDFSHGLALFERCPKAVEPLWVEGAGHNDIELYSQYLERLRRFINQDLAAQHAWETNNSLSAFVWMCACVRKTQVRMFARSKSVDEQLTKDKCVFSFFLLASVCLSSKTYVQMTSCLKVTAVFNASSATIHLRWYSKET